MQRRRLGRPTWGRMRRDVTPAEPTPKGPQVFYARRLALFDASRGAGYYPPGTSGHPPRPAVRSPPLRDDTLIELGAGTSERRRLCLAAFARGFSAALRPVERRSELRSAPSTVAASTP